METTVVGYPRIGENRELKFAIEQYWKQEITQEELQKRALQLREKQWLLLKEKGLDLLPSNTFSFYDSMLDTAIMLHAIPSAYQNLQLNELDTYFALARGYQGPQGDVKACTMKKWFNTNYHYMVPELKDDMVIHFQGEKLVQEYHEAKQLGIITRPVVIGPFTFLKLANLSGEKKLTDYVEEFITAYRMMLQECHQHQIPWLQIDEPSLVCDLDQADIDLFLKLYTEILIEKGSVKVLLQTYFGDIRDCYDEVMQLPFDGVGLDFIEGRETLTLLQEKGFPQDKQLFAGLINGKNIWKASYENILRICSTLEKEVAHIVLSTSCSLLHVPYTLRNEHQLTDEQKGSFAFAEEKLSELYELKSMFDHHEVYFGNEDTDHQLQRNQKVMDRVAALSEKDYVRMGDRADRQQLQKETLNIPILATTTIGSFPQTAEVKRNRSRYKKGEISKAEYDNHVRNYIQDCIKVQEALGLDVLVHGEYERNDMVEYFGEQLSGFVFTDHAWVQSYGTRCVKPPIIYTDIERKQAMTVEYITYAQGLTNKPVKGMLSGPVTILNWSFPREDISKEEMAIQLALVIRDEVLDLEKAGISFIQIDEAALREKLPLRKQHWRSEYLDWAIPAFRLCHSGVKQTTQIHTHMCYSEFEDIIEDIDAMDADVITFEASRSKLTILKALKQHEFATEVGPGVYDIHSPRIPSLEELIDTIHMMMKDVDVQKLWINPDCGLKTRGWKETKASLKNMVDAVMVIRDELKGETQV